MHAEYIQLQSEHSSLVELATRLGYQVYSLDPEQSLPGASPHYRLDDGMGRYSDGDNLVDLLAFMIKRELLAVTTPVT